MSDEKAEAAKTLIHQGISDFIANRYPDHDGTYVQGWAITAEWTSVELERSNSGGIITVNPTGQNLSVSRGLCEFGVDRMALYAPSNGDQEDA